MGGRGKLEVRRQKLESGKEKAGRGEEIGKVEMGRRKARGGATSCDTTR
jgi:hypothetical protein